MSEGAKQTLIRERRERSSSELAPLSWVDALARELHAEGDLYSVFTEKAIALHTTGLVLKAIARAVERANKSASPENMKDTLRTIKGLCEQAAREPEKTKQCLDMIVTLIRYSGGKKRKPSKRLQERAKREHERAHRKRAVAAREIDRHLQEKKQRSLTENMRFTTGRIRQIITTR